MDLSLVFPDHDKRRTFGPSSCKPHMPEPSSSRYRVVNPPDDGGPIIFHWHWPRGVLAARMSALELSAFILPHMKAILDMRLLAQRPRVEVEFTVMLCRFLRWPNATLNRPLPWVKTVIRGQEDDIIVLDLRATQDQPRTATIFY